MRRSSQHLRQQLRTLSTWSTRRQAGLAVLQSSTASGDSFGLPLSRTASTKAQFFSTLGFGTRHRTAQRSLLPFAAASLLQDLRIGPRSDTCSTSKAHSSQVGTRIVQNLSCGGSSCGFASRPDCMCRLPSKSNRRLLGQLLMPRRASALGTKLTSKRS